MKEGERTITTTVASAAEDMETLEKQQQQPVSVPVALPRVLHGNTREVGRCLLAPRPITLRIQGDSGLILLRRRARMTIVTSINRVPEIRFPDKPSINSKLTTIINMTEGRDSRQRDRLPEMHIKVRVVIMQGIEVKTPS